MRQSEQKEIPSLLERYELKYMIPESMIDPISEYLSIYCSLDRYSERIEDGFYTINTLYLDSPNFLFLRKRMNNAENRFNLRIRAYDSLTGSPCFFEIKQKLCGIVRKYRAAVSDKSWQNFFEKPGYEMENMGDETNKSNINLFYQTAGSHQAVPKVLTRYKRKAYISDIDDYARATFDRELCYQPAEGYSLIPDDNKMVSYDNAAVFDPECSVILELKCYSSLVPKWMLDIIRYFNLQRSGFSKYVTSITEALAISTCNRFDRTTTFKQWRMITNETNDSDRICDIYVSAES